MTRRFQTHGAWPPGHLANPARIRHSAMHAPNRGALDRNGSADRCLWQGQQQKLNGKDGRAVTQTLKAIAQKNGWFSGTSLKLYRVVRRSANRRYLRNRWLPEHFGQNVPVAPSFFTVEA